MAPGKLLTRLSIWLALAAYAVAIAFRRRFNGTTERQRHARLAWTLGCAFFLAHVVFAFAFIHHWSHEAAWRETARQTAELTGWHWGGGIYLNYLFAALWLGDVLWWWIAPTHFDRRSRWIGILWQGFFFFMVFNAAIVFAHGPARLLGIVLCTALAILCWPRLQRHGTDPSP